MAVSGSGGGAGLGHEDQVLVFTNRSQTTCTLTAYPGVAAVNADGQHVVQAMRTLGGYMGGLGPSVTTFPRVSLAPGQVASAIVEGTDNPIGTEVCPYYPTLLVTPPNLTEHVQVTVSGLGTQSGYVGLPGCSSIEIHPVVPGSKGAYEF